MISSVAPSKRVRTTTQKWVRQYAFIRILRLVVALFLRAPTERPTTPSSETRLIASLGMPEPPNVLQTSAREPAYFCVTVLLRHFPSEDPAQEMKHFQASHHAFVALIAYRAGYAPPKMGSFRSVTCLSLTIYPPSMHRRVSEQTIAMGLNASRRRCRPIYSMFPWEFVRKA